MASRSDKSPGIGEIELLQTPSLPMTADAILKDFTHYFGRMLGRRTIRTKSPFLYQAVVYTARDRLMERWARTRLAMERDHVKRTSYISLEFLMGRLLHNALYSAGIEDETREALGRLGLELETVFDREWDAGLGNGGLGRLAACFLDSCATLGAARDWLWHSLQLRHVPPAHRQRLPGRRAGPVAQGRFPVGGRAFRIRADHSVRWLYDHLQRPVRQHAVPLGRHQGRTCDSVRRARTRLSERRSSTRSACGPRRQRTNSISMSSMPAATKTPSLRRTKRRTLRWCCTRTTPPRAAESCA